jgi:hypothetical protein
LSVAKTATVNVGSSKNVKATVKTTKSVAKGDLKVTVKSSNKNVVTAKVSKSPSKKGKSGQSTVKLTGKKAGTATVTVTTKATNKKNKKVSKKIKVTVKGNSSNNSTTVEVTEVKATVSPSNSIVVGGTCVITASVVPENATNKKLTYTSSDSKVAVVTSSGVVTGISSGTAKITVSASNGKNKVIDITVNSVAVTGVSLDQSSVETTVAGTVQLKETVLPENATNKSVTWTSKDSTIASVTQDGVVTGVAAGTTKIIVASVDGNLQAECTVTVKNKEVVADGVTIEVTNAYEDESGNEYANTALVGDDINLRVRVMTNGVPVGSDSVTLTLTPVVGNMKNYYTVRKETVETSADGYATFSVGLKSDYSNLNAVSNYYQSFTVTAQESGSNKTQSTVIKFGSIRLSDLSVVDTVIEPSDSAAQYETGLYTTKSQNGAKNQTYVVSQQASVKGTSNHAVTLEATPVLVVPAALDSVKTGTWSQTVTNGASGSCTVYNDATNEATTVQVKSIPSGLQYLTLDFDTIELSKYTKMDVSVYNAQTGERIFNQQVDTTSNNSDVIQISTLEDVESYLVVSLISQGQVDTSSKGYVLASVSGPYKTTDVQDSIIEPISGSVTWEDVTSGVKYEKKAWSYDAALNYLPADSQYLNSDYTYSYKVPAFPYSGDAIITVTDTTGKEYYFLYPSKNEYKNGAYTNVNVIADAPDDKDDRCAIYATADEVNTLTGSLTTEGNIAILDSEKTGKQFVKATINVAGLDATELNSQNSGELYSSVEWAPVPTVEEVVDNPDYFAIEGQTVTVLAQLCDQNGNKKADEGKQIIFKDSSTTDNAGYTLTQGTVVGSNATITSVSGTGTDSEGQLTVTFRDITSLGEQGGEFSLIEGLTASSSGYQVKLSFDGGKTFGAVGSAADIYWVDLGLTYVNSADERDERARSTQFDDDAATITTTSTYPVSDTNGWKIGYQVVARSSKFQYTSPTVVDRTTIKTTHEFISIAGAGVSYATSSKSMTLDDATEKNVAIVNSTVAETTDVTGSLTIADTSAIVFKYYDDDGEIVTAKNIGNGDPAIRNTSLLLNTVWTVSGITVTTYAPPYVNKNSTADVYVRVVDNYDNPLSEKDVKYTITGVNATEDAATAEETDVAGVYKFTLPAPVDVTLGTSIISISVNDGAAKDSKTVSYVDDKYTAFTIAADVAPDYAVEVDSDLKTLTVYFTNNVDASTLDACEFKLVEDGTETSYKAENVTTKGTKAVTITLDREIENKTKTHTLSIAASVDKQGIGHVLRDSYGQAIADSEYQFKPSERQ